MESSVDPCEWGRRQAAASPPWSEDKWRRVAALLGMELAPPAPACDRDRDRDENNPPAEAA